MYQIWNLNHEAKARRNIFDLLSPKRTLFFAIARHRTENVIK